MTPKEFDDCPSSPDGKHSNSWYANFDCQHCNSGGQESTFARLYDEGYSDAEEIFNDGTN